MGKKKFYGCLIEDKGRVYSSWPECEAAVKGVSARYRGFPTRTAAEAWLKSGAPYRKRSSKEKGIRADLPEDALYFDAGTGAGPGVEVNVTDRDGTPLLHLALPEKKLTERGTSILSDGRTNNYGELFACLTALRIARKLGVKKLFGDSRLVLDYWSKGRAKAKTLQGSGDLAKLVAMTADERAKFEKEGGILLHVKGNINPADLGYHRD